LGFSSGNRNALKDGRYTEEAIAWRRDISSQVDDTYKSFHEPFRRASGIDRSSSRATGMGSRGVSALGIAVLGACASAWG
jgi:hypothetical protein